MADGGSEEEGVNWWRTKKYGCRKKEERFLIETLEEESQMFGAFAMSFECRWLQRVLVG